MQRPKTMLVEIFLVLCALFAWWKIKDNQKYAGYPPGPTRLPILGSIIQVILQFTAHPPLAFQKLAAKYGDVMFLKLGMMDTVIISGHEATVEVLQNDAMERHMLAFAQERNMNGNYGIFLGNGNVWQTLRRFTIRTLRDFGFGKSASMDEVISEEVGKFERHMRTLIKQGSGVVQSENIFDLPVLNVVWRLVTGKSHELDDVRMQTLVKLNHAYMSSSHFLDITVAYPGLRRWFPEWTGKSWQQECIQKFKDFLKILIEEHKASEDYISNPVCYVDVFLAKIEENAGTSSEFNEIQLVYLLLDMFQGASDTTSAVMSFLLLHMIRNPQIQTRIREEINAIVPPESTVTTAMKQKLPYTHATILESLRLTTIISFSIPREPNKDVSIRGHQIKKGTPIIINYETLHNPKSIWGDPQVFRPERFLTSDGTRINSKMTEYLVPFGGGKRVCMGQSLAETTAFIYFANLMRHFKFETVVNQPFPPVEIKLGFANSPKPFSFAAAEIK